MGNRGGKVMPYISKERYEEYLSLKEREHELPKKDALRLIIRACEGDPEKIGRHFLEVYARMKR